MTLGQRLKAYREREGLTQEQFAEYLNVSRQAVTKWEHDKGVPDIDNLVAISRRMGVTLDALVLGQEPAERAVPSFPVEPHAPVTPELPAAPNRFAEPEPEKSASSASSAALPGDPVPLCDPTLPGSKRGGASERARYHAFAALAFVFAAFCQVVAGCVNLAAAFRRSVPAFLPILSFCSALLLLYVAYAQAAACGRYRRKITDDPYCQK